MRMAHSIGCGNSQSCLHKVAKAKHVFSLEGPKGTPPRNQASNPGLMKGKQWFYQARKKGLILGGYVRENTLTSH